jgi:hypothetical protein
MSIPSNQAPSVKRNHSAQYGRRVKRMIRLLSSCERQSRADVKQQAHFWLTAPEVDDSRRMRSPNERLQDTRPTDSVKY